MDNLMNTVKQRASAELDTQKTRATDGLSAIAGVVRQTTQNLRNEQHDTIAQYVDRAADELDRFSNAVREKDLDQLLRDARQLARRQPALFIAGSFAVGLFAARFLKSSQRDGDGASGGDTYGWPDDRARTYPVRNSIADEMPGSSRGISAPGQERY